MFDIGFWEIALIMLVALLVIGPERLPRVARTTGLWVARLRRMVSSVKADIEREIRAQELKELMEKQAGVEELKGLRELEDLKELEEELAKPVDADEGAPPSQATAASPAGAEPERGSEETGSS